MLRRVFFLLRKTAELFLVSNKHVYQAAVDAVSFFYTEIHVLRYQNTTQKINTLNIRSLISTQLPFSTESKTT